jgi:hypothetical protein
LFELREFAEEDKKRRVQINERKCNSMALQMKSELNGKKGNARRIET